MMYIIPFPLNFFVLMAPFFVRGVILHWKWKKDWTGRPWHSVIEYKTGPKGVGYKRKEFIAIQLVWAFLMLIPFPEF